MRRLALLAVLSPAVFVSAACAGGASGSTITIEVRAENMRYHPEIVHIPMGETVKLVLNNLDIAEHDMEILGLKPATSSGGGHGGHDPIRVAPAEFIAVHAKGKKSASISFKVDQPGTYEFYCTITGHKELGMVGHVVVS
jgi:plastocyanin